MNDLLWHEFYRLGVQYAQTAVGEPNRLQPDAIRDAVREHIPAKAIEDSVDRQTLHEAFACGVMDECERLK